MSYNPGIPTANQTFKETQGPINTNFTVANNAFGIDHVNFQTVTNQGMHNKATFVTGSDPAAVVQGPIIYSKQVTYPGPLTKNEIFFRQSTGDGSNIVQLTDMFTGSVSAASSGSSFLPGGIIIKWGSIAAVTGANTVTFNQSFPNNCFSISLGVFNGNSSRTATFSALANNQFTLQSSSNQTVFYIAIGN